MIDFCSKEGLAVRKSVISTGAATIFAISLYILVFKGFGFPNISPMVDYFLRFLAALCAQISVLCAFRRKWILVLPTALTVLPVLWGGVLFVGSDSWQGVRFGVYLAEWCTPFLGCCAAWLIGKMIFQKD